MSKFYITGGYKGMTGLYGKRITPYFETPEATLHYKQTYGRFSLSLSEGKIEEKDD